MTQKKYFQTVPAQFDFIENENNIKSWWYEQDVISKYLQKNKTSDKNFSFIDGPITANGSMGVHHARGRTLKDVFQRFKNAQGYEQRFQNGFDCQGLWVEVEVEKEAGFNSKKDIQNYGLDKFTNSCLARVNKFSALQTEQSKRLGMFMDWENSYYTNSENNNLYIWHFLKIIWQKGWLSKRKSATTWCPRCETGLSQHEQADGYKEITDTSVYLMFELSDKSNEYVLAWTTTPWTLSANVLLAINPEFEYVKAKYNDKFLYLAKLAADRLGLTNYQPINPKTLLGLKYKSLFDIPAQKEVNHFIVEWDQVDPIEGTGVVHIAPGCGQEDFELGQKLGVDMIAPLDETGHFLNDYGDLSGKYAHDVSPIVFDYLTKKNVLFKTESITHRYPHCWRCKTKCLFRLEDSWYIKSDDIRPRLKETAQKVNWHPKYVGRRMQNWLDNMEDWMISRKRFYGLSLPFYECNKCQQLTVVGSKEELKSLTLKPELIDKLPSLHRPWIDEITIKCPKCGQEVKRIPDVGDCWLDAGVVPFSTLKYLSDKKYWQKWFPAELVLEMIEQVRLWFYSMLFFSVTLESSPPYLNVVAHSEVKDEKGERMSKTKKNGIPYDEAVEKMSADAMRWLYCQQKSHNSVNFGYSIADNVKRNFILIYWNTYRFFIEHANNYSWQPDSNIPTPTNILDRWILSRLNETISKTTKYLEKFDTPKTTAAIEKFVEDFSTWYVRRSRDRFDNYQTLYFCLKQLSILTAPFMPFLSETIFQNLNGNQKFDPNQSVHLQNWPNPDTNLIDLSLNEQMEFAREICKLSHAQRQKNQIKVRQPLANLTIKSNKPSLPSQIEDILKDETNVKNIDWQKSNSDILEVVLDTKLSPQLIEEGEYRDLARSIQVLRKEQNLNLNDKIKIFAPNWPEKYQQELLEKTLAVSIEKSDQLKILKDD